MAASPERFFAGPEPFSPSIFLNLPPTPRPDGSGEGKDQRASSDDLLVLPLIERMLMEEGMDDDSFLYQFPDDDPALLRAQEPYAQILSDSSSDASTTTLLESSHNKSTGGIQSSALLNDADDEEMKKHSNTMFAAGGGDHDALASAFFNDKDGGTRAMLRVAFLKGMQEANKFLPRDIKHVPAAVQVKDEEARNGNSRGCKNRHNIDFDLGDAVVLEAETGRKSKLMVPDPEESGEVVDEMVANGYELFFREVESLRISMEDIELSAEQKKKRRRRRRKGQSSPSNGIVVDLCTLLVHCAQAVAADDRRSATQLLSQIKHHSSPSGDATQRLAHCFAQGLEARLAGPGSQVYQSLMAKRTSAVDFLKAYRLFTAACCFKMMAFKFANMTICKAIDDSGRRKKVHIVDYGIHYGSQWPGLLKFFSTWPGGPPEVRITGIDLPQLGFRPAARVDETGRRLTSYASRFGVPFRFHGIAAKWETVTVHDLNIDPDAVLIVNSFIHFGNLMDEGVDPSSPSPRDVVLSNICKMRPDVFILFTKNGSYSTPYFVQRFREALLHYSTMFDMMDATTPRDSDLRILVERDLFGRYAQNAIACEGLDRVERPETYKQWQRRNHRAGLRQVPLDPCIVKSVRERVRDMYHEDFLTDVDSQWILGGWKGRILYAMSTWAADDAISQSS